MDIKPNVIVLKTVKVDPVEANKKLKGTDSCTQSSHPKDPVPPNLDGSTGIQMLPDPTVAAIVAMQKSIQQLTDIVLQKGGDLDTGNNNAPNVVTQLQHGYQ